MVTNSHKDKDVAVWFKLAVEHPYFSDEVRFRNLFHAHPSDKNADLAFVHAAGNELLVYGRKPRTAPSSTRTDVAPSNESFLPPTALSFGLKILDPNFLNYTEFGDQILMFMGTVLPQPTSALEEVRLGMMDGTSESIRIPNPDSEEHRFLIEKSAPSANAGFSLSFRFSDGKTYPAESGRKLVFDAPSTLSLQKFPVVFLCSSARPGSGRSCATSPSSRCRSTWLPSV